MRIKIWVEDVDTGEVLEDLGTCLTDSPNRAVQMYADDCDKYLEQGVNAGVRWTDITNQAAAALGSKGGLANTPEQNAARAVNAKKGGRPKGSKNKPKESHA